MLKVVVITLQKSSFLECELIMFKYLLFRLIFYTFRYIEKVNIRICYLHKKTLELKGIVLFIAAVIGVIISLSSILFWRKKSAHKVFLSFLIFLMMLHLVNMLVVANYGDTNHPFVNFLSLLFFVNLLLIPPSMYLYIKQYLSEKTVVQILKENRKHYFPAIALFLINICSFVILYRNDPESDAGIMVTNVMTYSNFIALFFIFLLQNVFYIYSALVKYKNHIKSVSNSFSFTEGISYPWVRIFILGYTVFTIALYLQTMRIFGNQNWSFALIIAIYVAFMLYNGFQIPSFSEVIALEKEKENEEKETAFGAVISPILIEKNTAADTFIEVKKVGISTDLQDKIWGKIETLMSQDKLYLDKDLTVYTLAKAAATNSKYLRLTINNKYEKNFAHYVNNYRVKKAKSLLIDREQDLYNVEYIGEMSGFKSKSAFYTAFKKQTGQTPQAYKKAEAGQ